MESGRSGAPARLAGDGLALSSSPASGRDEGFTAKVEARAVTQEHGRAILLMASSDDYGPLQRTLLLKSALAG